MHAESLFSRSHAVQPGILPICCVSERKNQSEIFKVPLLAGYYNGSVTLISCKDDGNDVGSRGAKRFEVLLETYEHGSMRSFRAAVNLK